VNPQTDFLHDAPPGGGGAARPSPVLNCLRCIEADHQQGNDTEHTHRPALKRPPAILNWNKLHIQCRQEICFGANISENMAENSWEKMDRWLQVQLEFSVEFRWKGRIQLCG
jgi:hypothetical protein